MCKEIVNFQEAQLALQQTEDLADHVHQYLKEWGELFAHKGVDQFQNDFEQVEELSLQLRKQIHQLRHKLQDDVETSQEEVTVTNFSL